MFHTILPRRLLVPLHLDVLKNCDCLAGMKQLDAGLVDLAFADPPFNIGYEYDSYDDRLESEKYLDWCRQWTAEVVRVLKPERHVLAGHRRRIRRRAEGHAPAGARGSTAAVGSCGTTRSA